MKHVRWWQSYAWGVFVGAVLIGCTPSSGGSAGPASEIGRYVAVSSTNALTIVLDTVSGDLIITQVQIPEPVVIKIPSVSLAVLPGDQGLRERLIKGQQAIPAGQPTEAAAPQSPAPTKKK